MNALELVHAENIVIMSMLCKLFLTKETGEELANKTTLEWNNVFEKIRNNL